MAIKKVLDTKEFTKVIKDLDILFAEENKKNGHNFLKISAESILNSWNHVAYLYNSMHVWVNYNENNSVDGMVMFYEFINPAFGQRFFMEYLWLSKNPIKSFQLINTALKFAKKRKIKYVTLSCVENYPKKSKLEKIYKKLGFIKDSSTYIKKL